MSGTTGIFNTTFNPAELNARSFAGTILRLFPNGSAPMFALSSQSGRSRAKSSTHGYFSKTLTFIRHVVGVEHLAAVTTMTVVATAGMVEGMVLHNLRTGENIRVTDVLTATQFSATRAFGRIAAATMNVADVLIHVGSAFEEGSVRPISRRLSTVYVPNYTQIFRNAWALTDTARASLAEAGYSNIAEDRKECSMFHAIDIEGAIIWGQPKMDTTGSTPMHATQGVVDALAQYASGNVTASAGATTSYEQLVGFLEPCFKYSTDASNPKERIVFVDNVANRVMNAIGRRSGQVQIMTTETSFGMHFTKFKFHKGTLNIVEHPLFNGLEVSGMALIMDMPALKLAYMDGRDTKPEEYGTGGKIVENGVDAQGGSLTTECAVELINPYSCGLIKGLTAGAYDAGMEPYAPT